VYDPIAQLVFARAAAVVCVSHAEALLVEAAYSAASGKLEIIPNGVDVEGISAATPFSIDRPVILVAGRHEVYKQVDLAIRAMEFMAGDALMVISGSGPQSPALYRLVKDLGIQDRVRFLGHVSVGELRRWQRTATVMLSLSRHEAFGLVLLEGAVAGAALVATDIPAHRELVASLGLEVRLLDVDASPRDVGAALVDAAERRPPVLPSDSLEALSWKAMSAKMLHVFERAVA
jgi:glycosyltransferase involved in cell wall biosynthesis